MTSKFGFVAFDPCGRFTKPFPERGLYKVAILKETPRMFRVRFLESAGKFVSKNDVVRVPKWACQPHDDPTPPTGKPDDPHRRLNY